MAFSLPRWSQGNPAVDDRGRILAAFKSFLDSVFSKVEEQEVRQDGVDTTLTQAVADLQTVQATLTAQSTALTTLTGQMNGLLTNYVPIIDAHTVTLTDHENRLDAGGL